MSKPVRHIASLDGLRAVSFMLVFIAHAGLDNYVPGGLGVTIFFFLSGFLITTLLRAEYEKNGAINFKHFWLRRALRILPPFYLVLGAAVAIALLFDPPGTLYGPTVASQALHYTNYWIIAHGYGGSPAGTGVYWSLAVEEHFYLLFPWLFAAMQRSKYSPRTQAMILWGLCVLVLAWRCVLVFGWHVPTDRTYLATDTRVDSILFGCALAVWNNPVLDEIGWRERRWKLWYVPAALIFLSLCLMVRDPSFRETFRYSIQGAALTVFFVAAIRFPHWAPFRLLNLRAVAFIGVLSYSLYLLHFAVIFGVHRLIAPAPALLQGVVAFGISLALSWIIYRLVEKPCARLRKRLTD